MNWRASANRPKRSALPQLLRRVRRRRVAITSDRPVDSIFGGRLSSRPFDSALARVLNRGSGYPVDPHHVAQLEFAPVMGLNADPPDRLSVMLVGEEDFLAAVAPVFAPLAQRQHNRQ